MERNFNEDRRFKLYGDKLFSIHASNNLIIETSYNNIDFCSNAVIFDGHVELNRVICNNISISNVSEISSNFVYVNNIDLPSNNKLKYNSVNNGYIRNTSIGIDNTSYTIGRSDAYFTYINVSGGDASFNTNLTINKDLLIDGTLTISNDLLINGNNFASIENSFNIYRAALEQNFYSAKIVTNDLSASAISISNNLVALKTAYFNDISINGQLLNNVLKVPALFTIDPSGHGNASGTLIINGDLTVNGLQTSIASSVVDICDQAITLASNLVLANIQDLSSTNAGLDISNIASLKYNGTLWNFSGGQLSVQNNKVLLIDDVSLAKRDFDLSINEFRSDFSSSFFALKRNIDNSYNATYTRTQIDNSFILKSNFDICSTSLRSYVDSSYISKSTFTISYGDILTLMDTSYVEQIRVGALNQFDSSFQTFNEKLDISYLLNSVFEASHNKIKTDFDISFATINANNISTSASSITIENINTRHFSQRFANSLWNQIGQDISSIPNNKINNNKNVVISNDGTVVAMSLNDNLSIQQVEQIVSTWTGSTTQACEWSSICWSPQRERFVAVANDGYIMTSSNGINWTNVPIFNSFNSVDSTTTVTNLLNTTAVASPFISFAITSELAQNELIAAIGQAQSGTAGNIYVQDVSGATLTRNLITLTGAGQTGSQRLGQNISITNDAQFIVASTDLNGKLHLWKKNSGSTLGYTYLNSFTMTDQTSATNIKVKLTTNSVLDVPYEMLLAVGIREGATGNIGRARVYSINKTTGAFTLVDQFAGAIADNGFGLNIGISPNGVTFVVQASSYIPPTAFCNIYTYNYTTSLYTLTQTINGQVATTGSSPPNPRWDDFPGSKIVFNSSSSNTMALASFVASFGVGVQVGYVDIYNKVSNTWVLYQRIDGTINAQYFGGSIGFDANGSTLIIGGSGSPNMTVYRKFIDSSYVSVANYTPGGIAQATSSLLSADGTRYIISSGTGTTGRFFCGNVITRGVSLKSICWSQELGLFVATATSGTKRVMTSPDGLIWSGRTAAEANPWLGVCWSPELGLFAAVASSGTNRVMISSNGTNWTPITVTDTSGCTSICWSSELRIFVALSSNNGRYRVMTSNDGTIWTGRTAAEDNSWNSVCWSPDLAIFVALSGNSGTYRVMTSNDGISWTGISVAEANGWNSVCWSPQLKLFIAVGTNCVMTSRNGIDWTSRTAAQSNNWLGLCWSPEQGIAVAVSDNGSNRVMTSLIPTTSRSGSVYVYELSYNNWSRLGNNTIVGLSGDELGYSLALSSNGRIVAASSLYNDTCGNDAGQVRVYELSSNTNNWIQKGSNINGPRPGSESGYSISLAGSGNRIAIGAWKDNSNGTNAGDVRVYDFSAGVNDWRQQGQTIVGISGSFEGYSTALSLDGQTLASGSIVEPSTNIITVGPVKTFTISGNTWTSKGIIQGPQIYLGTISATSTVVTNTTYQTTPYIENLLYSTNKTKYLNLFFGRDIKLSSNGNKIVIGATGPTNNEYVDPLYLYYRFNQGSIYTYEYTGTGTTWTQLGQIIHGISGGDEFGSSVSMSNDGTLISVGSNNNNYNRGQVRVFAYVNNYWYQLSNSINGKTSSSRAGIHALSGDGRTLIQSNNTYNSVYGLNRSLAFIPSTTTISTTISGDLAVTGKAILKSFRISNKHNFDVSINGYSSHYLATTDISASIVDYYSNVGYTYNRVFKIDACGNVSNYSGLYGAVSDSRLKENIVNCGPKLADLLKVRVVNYNLKGPDKTKYIGVLAQELEELFPELVVEDNTHERIKSVNYSNLTIMLIKAFQEQQVLINNLYASLKDLEKDVDTL